MRGRPTKRHLNETQRAMVAAKLANMSIGAAIGNKYAAKTENKSENFPICFVSQSAAAEMLNISGRLVGHAKKVLTDGAPPPERNPAGHGRGEAGEYAKIFKPIREKWFGKFSEPFCLPILSRRNAESGRKRQA